VIAEFDVGYQRPRPGKRDQRDLRRVGFFIDVGDGYGSPQESANARPPVGASGYMDSA
jgi:hypothetical protein